MKNNRRRGVEYEQRIARELRELGYSNVVTSRSESKTLDDQKIDLVDKDNNMPCYCQLKRTKNTPDYFKIVSECPLKDKPFVIIWSKQIATEKTFRSVGELVMMSKDFFYELINPNKQNGKM